MIRPGPEKHGVWPNLSLDNALLILGIPPPPKNGIPSFNEAVASENSKFHFSIVFTKYQHFLSANGLPNV